MLQNHAWVWDTSLAHWVEHETLDRISTITWEKLLKFTFTPFKTFSFFFY